MLVGGPQCALASKDLFSVKKYGSYLKIPHAFGGDGQWLRMSHGQKRVNAAIQILKSLV